MANGEHRKGDNGERAYDRRSDTVSYKAVVGGMGTVIFVLLSALGSLGWHYLASSDASVVKEISRLDATIGKNTDAVNTNTNVINSVMTAQAVMKQQDDEQDRKLADFEGRLRELENVQRGYRALVQDLKHRVEQLERRAGP